MTDLEIAQLRIKRLEMELMDLQELVLALAADVERLSNNRLQSPGLYTWPSDTPEPQSGPLPSTTYEMRTVKL